MLPLKIFLHLEKVQHFEPKLAPHQAESTSLVVESIHVPNNIGFYSLNENQLVET